MTPFWPIRKRNAMLVVGVLLALAWLALRRDPWAEALRDPATRRALDEGLADLEAGRVQPWDPRTVELTTNALIVTASDNLTTADNPPWQVDWRGWHDGLN